MQKNFFHAVPGVCGKDRVKGSHAVIRIARSKIEMIKETNKIWKTEGNQVQDENGN